jgi:nucleoside-diphosphate-sugar epimerase
MKVLVTGGTGFLGRHLVERLAREGHEVSVLARRATRLPRLRGLEVRTVAGDLRQWSSLSGAVAGQEAVIHCAGHVAASGRWIDYLEANVLGTERLIQKALEAGVDRFVHVSSIGVYGLASPGTVVTEDSGYDPDPASRGFYTRSKIEADQLASWYAARERAPITIVRPGTIYGPGGKAGLVRAGTRVGPLHVVFGDGSNQLPLTYVDNVVDALLLAATRVGPPGRAYTIVDEEQVTQRAYLERLGPILLGREPRTVYLPLPVVQVLAGLADRARATLRGRRSPQGLYHRISRSLQSVRYDTTRARTELGWKPRITFEEALQRIREERW